MRTFLLLCIAPLLLGADSEWQSEGVVSVTHSPHAKPKGRHCLRLYVAGASARSRLAVRRVYQLCEAELKGNYDLEVIDVYQDPELARGNQIVAPPTLVKEFPLPVRRFIGNLSNTTGLFTEPGSPTRGRTAP